MSELSFIKSFLSTLDSRPIKLRADHVQDQGQTPRAPYFLPRLQPPHPSMPKKTTTKDANPGSSKSINITLKSARNPALEFTLPNAPLATTSVSDLKDAVRERIVESNTENKVSLEKIKILFKRKPVSGTGKTVAEVVSDAGEEELLSGGKGVEFGVMVMGGARVVDGQDEKGGEEGNEEAAAGQSGEALLETEQFWVDLQGYLGQRLKDDDVARKWAGLFKDIWTASR
ncbi:cell-cycle control medial ring component-domain-containing protein [Aspergillus aurantiobrunneus]